ncbi:copia protein [Tanacetum coccineum]
MNYIHVSVENHVNVDVGTQDSYIAGSSGKDKGPTQEYILLPLQSYRTRIPVEDVAPAAHEKPSESSPKDNDVQDSEDVADKEGQHQMTEDEQFLHDDLEKMIAQEVVQMLVNHHLLTSDAFSSDGIFNEAYDDENVGAVADFHNWLHHYASPIPTFESKKNHPKDQILGDPKSAVQTRGKIQKASSAQQALAQGFRQEEGIDYDEVFAPVARIEAIKLFLAFASYMGFTVYQIDVKSTFPYDTIEEEVYVHQPPGFVDLAIKQVSKSKTIGIFISRDKYVADILKKFDFWSIGTATTPIESNKPLIKDEDGEDVDCKVYSFKDSPFELEAFSDSNYGGASLDRKSTTGGCQFLGRRLISWQCKKQTIVANSTTKGRK